MSHPTNWLTVDEIAAGTGWQKGSIYRLAHDDQWRRRDRHNPARYAADDVLATITRRALADHMARPLDKTTGAEESTGQGTGIVTTPDQPDRPAQTP